MSENEEKLRLLIELAELAPAAFKAKDDRIAKLERELAESKAREEQLRLDAARWALFRDTPSGTFDQYKDEWRFRCNVIGGMWCKSKDDAMDYALSKLQPSGHITQKGDTNADV